MRRVFHVYLYMARCIEYKFRLGVRTERKYSKTNTSK